MSNTRTGRSREPSIHQSALDNLRRGGKTVGILLGGLALVMGLFVVGALVVTKQNMPTPPPGYDKQPTQNGPAGPTSDGNSTAWRKQLTDFLTDADHPSAAAAARWFPGAADSTDRFTYTPQGPNDPGARQQDGTAQVPQLGMPSAQAMAVLSAVSRNGTVQPPTLAVSTATGTDRGWTLRFVVKAKDATWLQGEAMGYVTTSGRTVILRTTYQG